MTNNQSGMQGIFTREAFITQNGALLEQKSLE